MKKSAIVRLLLAAAVGLFGIVGFVGLGSAQNVNNPCFSANNTSKDAGSTTDNAQNCNNEGDAEGEISQEGSASSGDGVAGQVAGVVSAGDASVDATNRSDDVDVSTGNATGVNNAALNVAAGAAHAGVGGNVNNPCFSANNDSLGGSTTTNAQACANLGDADGSVEQSAEAASGDGVGGQVIGVVTSAGGSADLVLDNESTDSDVATGDGNFANAALTTVRTITFFAG